MEKVATMVTSVRFEGRNARRTMEHLEAQEKRLIWPVYVPIWTRGFLSFLLLPRIWLPFLLQFGSVMMWVYSESMVFGTMDL